MPLFRTDRYVKITIADFDLVKSSEALLQILQQVSDLRNVQMTKVRINREEQGKIKVEEWYELTGSLNVPEGGKSFWAISKPSTKKEPYHFFMRIDRNVEAEDVENAQNITSNWVKQLFIEPIESSFSIEEKTISSPQDLSKIVTVLSGSK